MWKVYLTDEDGNIVYATLDNKTNCGDKHPPFQAWLSNNKDNLPNDIQAKIDAGELTIADAE